ncbi:MAG: hypothetical protein Q9222_002351 [Ikaeria aurantiellina]
MVLVPPLSAESRSSEYVTFQDDESFSPRKKQKTEQSPLTVAPVITKDQKLVADQASSNFQNLLKEIFEVDEHAGDDGPTVSLPDTARHFMWVDQDDIQLRVLAPSALIKLESCLQKVIAVGKVGDIAIDDACRLQGLCEKSLMIARSLELSIDTPWNSDDFSAWIQRASSAETALRSARIIVRIMTGHYHEKRLCSEELLQHVLDVLNKVFTSCLIPFVECRPKDAGSEIFDLASPYKKEISQLLYQATRVMKMLVGLLDKVDVADGIITSLEFFAIRVLFVENAQSEKESLLGVQKFEGLRRVAMDIITGIFTKYPEQRSFLFDEILASLQKLPTKGPNARQYKLSDGTTIQLVSALIMQLIQTSASTATEVSGGASLQLPRPRKARRSRATSSDTDDDTAAAPDDDPDEAEDMTDDGARRRLAKEANSLNDNAAKDAQYVVRYLVKRAMTASKSGDQPHRHLLDMFVEDMITMLDNPEWPAAELLLRALLLSMVSITENKSTAPAKNMALELLGMMGSAISELVANTQSLTKGLETNDSLVSGNLRQLFEDYLDGSLQNSDMLNTDGPYRVVIDYLASIDSDGLSTKSAQIYYLTQWARAVASTESPADRKNDTLVRELCKALHSRSWDQINSADSISKGQCQLAYALTVLNMSFCRQFDSVLRILVDSIASEQTTVRTRSLKSITQMLEKDPSLLERARSVKGLLIKCAADTSPMVRDSTLMLIGKCIQQKPTLEQEFFKSILSLANDPTANVRKRAMKLLKEAFARNKRKEVRVLIAECLLQRSRDDDKATSEMANQMLEEALFSPFWKCSRAPSEVSIQDRLALKEQVNLITNAAQANDVVTSALVVLLQKSLSSNNKVAEANSGVCRMLVSTAFEGMIDSEARSDGLEQKHIVQMLTVFARADARLFNAEQLQHLQPYISNLSSAEDFSILRFVVIIFRCVLPVLPTVQQSLIREVQTALLGIVSKLGKMELNEVAACLWTMNGILNNPDRLVRLVASVIKHLQSLKVKNISDQSGNDDLRRAKKCVQIAGAFGRHCDFEGHKADFERVIAGWRWRSVSGMIVSSIQPFADNKQPLPLQVDAINSIGLICQSSPHHFNQADISEVFQRVLTEGMPDVQNIVLANFRDFFAMQEAQAAIKNEPSQENGPVMPNGRLGGSMKASESDGASALIAQRFLHDILSIALASLEASALTATEVVASINRQGLVHPKESGPALVALETSPNRAIADVAYQAHCDIHLQHESMFEREYMRAIHEAYKYQRDIVKDPLGFRTSPYISKLHSTFEIIKGSKSKYQKKFISNYCAKINFDVDKLELSGDVPASLQFTRFLIENLAFFDYGRVDELLHTLSCMEKIVADTGSGVAHNINTEVFHVRVDAILGVFDGEDQKKEAQTNQESVAMTTDVTPVRLHQLTTASIILSSLWEARTYLRRLYGLASTHQARENKANGKVKDVNRAPTKTNGITGERVVVAIAERVKSLSNRESMLKQCQDFVELLSVDQELKVAAEVEEDGVGRPWTPSGDEGDSVVPLSGGSRGTVKRKRSTSAAVGTPHKKRGRPLLGRRKSSRKSADEDEDWG